MSYMYLYTGKNSVLVVLRSRKW